MTDFDYQESVNLGATPLNEDQVDEALMRLHFEYPACSYHITRRNCLTFADVLVGHLKPPQPFPVNLKGIIDAACQAPGIDATVDYGWSWAKWYMARKHQPPEPGDRSGGSFWCMASGSDRQSSVWDILLQP